VARKQKLVRILSLLMEDFYFGGFIAGEKIL
jgi:hypothetical protein